MVIKEKLKSSQIEMGNLFVHTTLVEKSKTTFQKERNGLAEVLPEIVRTTTLGAEDRVNRFYCEGGFSSCDQKKSKILKATMLKHTTLLN